MQIGKDTVVTLTYRLTSLDGELLEEAAQESPVAYLHGGYDGIFPKVEAALEGQGVGMELDLTLDPEDAFGEYDAELVRVEPAHLFPENVEVGMQMEGSSDDGHQHMLYTVTDIADGKVVVDGNHPLAGMALIFSCTVADVRAATADEIDHGHVHGVGAHLH